MYAFEKYIEQLKLKQKTASNDNFGATFCLQYMSRTIIGIEYNKLGIVLMRKL